MATRLGIHTSFGPSPSVEMFLSEMALMARDVQRLLLMKDPIPVTSWNFIPRMPALDPWMLNTDNPRWGNNADTTSSFGVRMPRLQLIRNSNPREEVGKELVVYNLEFAQRQIIENLHPSNQNSTVHASGLQTQVIEEVPLSSNPHGLRLLQ